MFESGKPVLIVEYRSSKAERITWRDKTSKAMTSAPMLRHTCEAVDGSCYIVSERVPENFDVDKFQPSMAKGSKAVLLFSSMSTERGITQFQGHLEVLK